MKRIFLLLFAFTTLSIYAQNQVPKELTANTPIKKFEEVVTYIDKLYLDQVDQNKLIDDAIIGMFEKLDPHSMYIPKKDVEDANDRINGNFIGIGIRFQILKDTLFVVETIAGGPSQKLGIQAGDKIIRVENQSIAGVGIKNDQVREKLMGELASKVKIEILRPGQKNPISYIITRDRIPIYSVDCAYMLSDVTGYIKLNSFSRTTPEEIMKNIIKLKSKGMKNLILDLQDNGGGLLYSAKELVDEFLKDSKLIVYSEGKAQPRSELKADRKGLWEDGKLVLLIDESSASASEIVSGAIQDWDRGVLVGRRSFGKGLVQRPIELNDGSQIRLTIARYFTPSGRFIQKPYNDLQAYKNDYMNRYLHGEFSNQDSIRFPDSLCYQTLVNHRKVYAGGGIMPDYFVPIDTVGITDYYRSLVRGRHFNAFTLQYANENRSELNGKYPNFDSFDKNFEVDKKYMNEFLEYVKKEQPDLVLDKKQFSESEDLMKLRLKAILAQDLWSVEELYRIYNKKSKVISEALNIIESEKYNQLLLAK